jgi:hypothetical protein
VGINDGGKMIFKISNVVAQELNMMLNDINFKNASNTTNRIDCGASKIKHQLSFRHSWIFSTTLAHNVASCFCFCTEFFLSRSTLSVSIL